MEIKRLYGIENSRKATGVTVIVDVLRAATVSAYILAGGAKYIIPVSTKEEAFLLKRENPHYLLVGEEGGYKIKGFNYGNSPSEISKVDLRNRIIIQRSSQGIQGLLNAILAEEVIFGSFVIASSIKDYIKNLSSISIVAMNGTESEDDIFADYLEKIITLQEVNMEELMKDLKTCPAAQKFFDPSLPEFPEKDFYLSLEVNKFNFLVVFIEGKVIKK
ncbi:MAG TPA: 2-phosphosulfolactate phosphatase [Candidatus Eremiobacteraeota bacterium]|nr:MAG: putative 2-phosphosulfolactate phosphatase [bacterium ADurb.Bin363]HPZ06770.1 2-phosphosulfolactate phosphatase [Candidatus Eremiobacteraeota bacterium]